MVVHGPSEVNTAWLELVDGRGCAESGLWVLLHLLAHCHDVTYAPLTKNRAKHRIRTIRARIRHYMLGGFGELRISLSAIEAFEEKAQRYVGGNKRKHRKQRRHVLQARTGEICNA